MIIALYLLFLLASLVLAVLSWIFLKRAERTQQRGVTLASGHWPAVHIFALASIAAGITLIIIDGVAMTNLVVAAVAGALTVAAWYVLRRPPRAPNT